MNEPEQTSIWYNFDTGRFDHYTQFPADLRPYVHNSPLFRKTFDKYVNEGKTQLEAYMLLDEIILPGEE